MNPMVGKLMVHSSEQHPIVHREFLNGIFSKTTGEVDASNSNSYSGPTVGASYKPT